MEASSYEPRTENKDLVFCPKCGSRERKRVGILIESGTSVGASKAAFKGFGVSGTLGDENRIGGLGGMGGMVSGSHTSQSALVQRLAENIGPKPEHPRLVLENVMINWKFSGVIGVGVLGQVFILYSLGLYERMPGADSGLALFFLFPQILLLFYWMRTKIGPTTRNVRRYERELAEWEEDSKDLLNSWVCLACGDVSAS